MEVDQETVFSCNRHDHSKRISYTQIMWRQNDAQKFKSNCVPAQSIGSKEFSALACQRKTTAVPRVFTAQANTEHAVYLQEV